MMWIDVKYASMASARLQGFKLKRNSPYLANCRCPYCGDSDYNKNKARGYLLEKGGKMFFYCHNCGASHIFARFLKDIDARLHDEYRLECIKEVGASSFDTKREISMVAKEPPFKSDMSKFSKHRTQKMFEGTNCVKVSSLKSDHFVKKYVDGRKIAPEKQYLLYYTPAFCAMVNTLVPGKLVVPEKDHSRLIIPFLDRDGRLFGFQGRNFSSTGTRYITIMMDEALPKVFGLDRVNEKNDVFVCEGPIDSLFLPNAIAMAGSDVHINDVLKDPSKAVFMFDNEPRSKTIVSKIEKKIDEGHRVVILPSSVQQKDVNDMVMKGGYELEEISVMIHRNMCSGLAARMRLAEWKKT
jgi:DNA primase